MLRMELNLFAGQLYLEGIFEGISNSVLSLVWLQSQRTRAYRLKSMASSEAEIKSLCHHSAEPGEIPTGSDVADPQGRAGH